MQVLCFQVVFPFFRLVIQAMLWFGHFTIDQHAILKAAHEVTRPPQQVLKAMFVSFVLAEAMHNSFFALQMINRRYRCILTFSTIGISTEHLSVNAGATSHGKACESSTHGCHSRVLRRSAARTYLLMTVIVNWNHLCSRTSIGWKHARTATGAAAIC